MEEYAKAVEDQTWLSNVARGTQGADSICVCWRNDAGY